jgi:inosine-uridine nucleoside N-ribohydrolase
VISFIFLLVGIEFNFAADPIAASRVLEEFQTVLRIITFELTCMSTISYEILESEMLPLKSNPANLKARLFAEVSQFLIDFTKSCKTNPELYTGLNSCDSVCMACVLDETIINEKKHVYACVEPFGKLASGHMISDWYGHFKRESNVEIITDIDKEKFLKIFRLCVEE